MVVLVWFPPLNSVNVPPAFHQPQTDLRTFAGENFVFQFAASDPEGSALLFQLEDGPNGAVLSPAGLLIWRVPTLLKEEEHQSRHSVHFTLSDECNAQSSFTVQVVLEKTVCHILVYIIMREPVIAQAVGYWIIEEELGTKRWCKKITKQVKKVWSL